MSSVAAVMKATARALHARRGHIALRGLHDIIGKISTLFHQEAPGFPHALTKRDWYLCEGYGFPQANAFLV